MGSRIFLADILNRDRNSFGLVRLMAACLVVVSHGYYITIPLGEEPLTRITGYSLGAHAVHAFFAISGCLVMASWDRRQEITAFALARLIRIFPALIVVTLLIGFALGPLVSAYAPWDYFRSNELPRFFVRSVVLLTGSGTLPGVFENAPGGRYVDVPLWTLKYEVLCYLLLAALGVLGLLRRRETALVVLGLLASLAIARILYHPLGSAQVPDHIARLGLAFLLGMAAWHLRSRIWFSFWPLAGLVAFDIALARTPLLLPAMILTVGYGTFYLSSFRFGALGALAGEFDISYGVYIMGYPVQQALYHYLPACTGLANALLALGVVAPLALLSWIYVEKPALRLRGLAAMKKAPAGPGL